MLAGFARDPGRLALSFISPYPRHVPTNISQPINGASEFPQIPLALAEAVKRGEAILFLGAGASFGARHADGREMPMGSALRDLICDRFLSGLCKDRNLDEVASLAENATGQGELDQFISQSVRGFIPPEQHKLIAAFRWKAIFGTNYDLLLEDAFKAVSDPLQTLKPFYRDTGIERELATAVDPVPYYKLHGTIDHLHDRDAPLILTQESYLNPRHNRRRLFGRLEDLGNEYPVVFIGTRLADQHIRQILAAVDAAAGTRPTYYFVAPGLTSYDDQLLAARRMTPISSTFAQFMHALNAAVDPVSRRIYGAIAAPTHSIERHFRRKVQVPAELRAFLTDNVEHVHAGLSSSPLTADLFFKGESGSWQPIERNYDIERQIYTRVMIGLLDIDHSKTPVNVVVIRGTAGAGKSVLGRRLAYDLATQHDKIVLFAGQGAHLRADPLLDLHNLTGQPLVLIIDQAADQQRWVEDLIARLSSASIPATLVLLDTNAAFGASLDPLSPFIRSYHELRSLTRREIEAILNKLELHQSLGLLESMSRDERIATFEGLADHQMLVALYEATHGRPLEELLVDEYHRIVLNEAQELYLLVCALNRFNIPLRAGLVSRVMGVSFQEFEKRFLGPLEGLVFAEMDPQSRDYAYRARHAHIAEIVFRRILDTQTKQSELYIKVIEGLNPTYASDNVAMRKMLTSRNLRDLSFDASERRRILKVAARATDNDPFVLQQQAILEMNTAGGDLEAAAEWLDGAIAARPRDPSLKHSKAALLARRANLLKDSLSRRAMRNQARSTLAELKGKSGNDAYALALKATLAIDDLEDVIADLPADAEAPAEPAVVRLVEDAERALESGLAGQPDFEALTREAYRLQRLLGERKKGIALLRRTLEKQPHLEFVAITFARAVASIDLGEAITAVRRTLVEKPNSKPLNQTLFELMVQESDDQRPSLLGPLRKSFTPGDGNLIMHVHAIRYFFMRGERTEFESSLASASSTRASWSELEKPRFPIRSQDGPRTYVGTIAKLGGTFGFIRVPELIEPVYIRSDHFADEAWDAFREGMAVSLQLYFNLKGAIGQNVIPQPHA